MIRINIEFTDYRGEHSYGFEVDALPRVGETVDIKSDLYKVTKVTHDMDTGHVTLQAKKTRR